MGYSGTWLDEQLSQTPMRGQFTHLVGLGFFTISSRLFVSVHKTARYDLLSLYTRIKKQKLA